MRSLNTVALVAALAAVCSPAGAEQNSTRALLNALRATQNGVAPPAAIVARAGKFIVKATFTKQTPATGTLFCTAHVGNFSSSALVDQTVQQAAAVTFSGATGTCIITMPYHWAQADSTTGVQIELDLSNIDCLTAGGCTAASRIVFNTWGKAGPLPANGVTTTYDFGALVF